MFDLRKIALTGAVVLLATPSLAGKDTSGGTTVGTPAVPPTTTTTGGDSGGTTNPIVAINQIVSTAQSSLDAGASTSSAAGTAQTQAASLISSATPAQVQQVVSVMTSVVASSGATGLPLSQAQAVSAIGILRALAAAGQLNPTLQGFLNNLVASTGA